MKKIITIIIIIIFIILIVKGWWENLLAPASVDQVSKIVVVAKGESFSQVAADLEKQKLIKSAWAFSLYARQNGLSAKIQAGSFKLSQSMTAEQILKVLSSQPLDNWVTLLEGWRVEEMAKKLNDSLGVSSSEFLKIAKEGYMFPDTYLFPKDYTSSKIVKKLEDTFDDRYSNELRIRVIAQGLTENQGVILASIVEREARSDEARKMVASILLKRFKIGMGLNADATVQYALGYQSQERSWWKRQLSLDDLKIDSPYNTYIHMGLPPAPISNPGLSSLQAVANADPNTPYLYYYHDSKGISRYAKTLEEHNKNVANYP